MATKTSHMGRAIAFLTLAQTELEMADLISASSQKTKRAVMQGIAAAVGAVLELKKDEAVYGGQ